MAIGKFVNQCSKVGCLSPRSKLPINVPSTAILAVVNVKVTEALNEATKVMKKPV